MSHELDLKAILKAQINALEERLNLVKGEEKNLRQNPKVNTDALAAKNVDILNIREQIEDIKIKISELEVMDKEDNSIKDNKKLAEIAKGISDLLDQSGQAFSQAQALEEAHRIAVAQNQIVIEQQVVQEQSPYLTNTDENLKTVEELAEGKARDLREQTKEMEDRVKDAYEESNQIPEPKVPEAARKWKQDLVEKENTLNNSVQNQLNAIEKNKAMLEIQIEDAKKFPDAEKKINQLNTLNEVLINEEKKVNNKLVDGANEILREKEALQKAVESSKNIVDAGDQQKAIQDQRKEFERQREIEKQRQLEEQNRNR